MIISYKKKFIQQWRKFTKSKIDVDFSTLKLELSKEIGQWPGTVHIFYPLVNRCCVRKEKFGNLMLFFDAVFEIDDLTIKIFEHCDGLNSPQKIKELVKKSYGENSPPDLEEKIENILSQAGKFGAITWIPLGQPHIEQKIKALGDKFGKSKFTKTPQV